MKAGQTILGEVTGRSKEGQIVGVDLATLVQRLLLFDTVVVKSRRLVEIPEFIRLFGKAGFLQLINAGVLKISCEFTTILGDPVRNGVRQVPLSHFTFGLVNVADREGELSSALRPLQGIAGLKNDERKAMEETIIQRLVRPSPDYGPQLLAQFESDLRNNTPALAAAIKNQLQTQFAVYDRPFDIFVDETAERVFHLKSNLATVLGVSDRRVHDVLSLSAFAVAHLNQRLADMVAYSAISGFAESEAALLFGKLAGIIAPQNPRPLEEEFERVIRIAKLPNLLPNNKINVEALFKARDSLECREFRSWLSTLKPLSDAEIEEMVGGVRNKVTSIIQSGPAKTVRFAVATVIGLIPGYGPIAGAAAGAIDSFLINRLLPVSGVFAFLTKTYPSLFEPE
jgi:hypothetical protein